MDGHKIEQIAIADLKPYKRNSRTHSEVQIDQVAASIREFGFTNPVLVGADNVIIAGHCRVMAARKLDMPAVPCIRITHLTEAQRRAYVIADNKLALNAGWDYEALRLELEVLAEQGFNLDLTGFGADDLTSAILGAPFGGDAPESSAKEIDPENYNMGHKCPKCGFEFDAKA